MRKLIIFLIFLSLTFNSYPQEVITGFENKDLSVLNEELRRILKDIYGTENSISTIEATIADIGKVLISANDTTLDELDSKLVAGARITFTENNDGGNETLTIAVTDVAPIKVVEVSPSGVQNVIVSSSLSPGKRYRLYIAVRVASVGATGSIGLRFNNVTSNTYSSVANSIKGGTAYLYSGGPSRILMLALNANTYLVSNEAFIAEAYINTDPSDSTIIYATGSSSHSRSGAVVFSTWAGTLNTGSNLSRLDVWLNAGNMTGTIALYELP